MLDITPGDTSQADLLIVPVLEDRTLGTDHPSAPDLDDFEAVLDARDFSGKKGQTAFIQTAGGDTSEVLLVGLGSEVDVEGLRRAAGSAARAASGYEAVASLLHTVDVAGATEAVTLGTLLGSYSFDTYRSKPKDKALASVVLVGEEDPAAIGRAAAVAKGVALARDLINTPARDKSPETIAALASDVPGEVAVTIYDEDAIEERGFGGLQAVNLGADRPARMVVMEYAPEGASKTVAFVGKGIVFDSGGLSIKPAAGMETMKTDMSGAAAVIGAVQAIAELGLNVRVIGISPLTENMTGGSAQRPGDVMTAYKGKTIEVLNTDAEGRLVLADGLGLANDFDPDVIVDIATLTGACKVALGPLIGGLLSNDDDAAELVEGAAHAAGEKFWRLPLEQEYRKLVDSDIADMKNTGGRWGGTITAGLILEEFVDDTPWVHLDIAGPARADSTEHYITKGGTGFGVRTLVAVAEALSE